MRGSERRNHRLKRTGMVFSAVGLVMTVFLAIGQVGLIAASADGWNDRSGGSASTRNGGSTDVIKVSPDGKTVTKETSSAHPAISASPSSLNVDLDQYANDDAAWQNGDLNGNNSAYSEGDVVPFRLAIEGLAAGSHTIHLDYDFTAGGHEAYDFLATWNVTENPGLCDTGGGAVSSMCPALGSADTKAFPSDSFVPGAPTQAGSSVAGAEAFAGVSRDLTMYGGTITSITGPTHSGPVGNNSDGDLIVTFNATGSAVLFAWGGHLAQSAYWKTTNGDPNGAGEVTGAPWHMRTQQLDDSSNKNQDRSIQPSAIYEPSLDITKEAVDVAGAPVTSVSPGDSFSYVITVTNNGNADATDVVVTDDLDDSLTIDSVSWELSGGLPNACTVGAGNTVRCPSGSGTATIPAGSSLTVTINVTTDPDVCDTLLNTAHVDWAQDATQSGLDSSQASVDVTGCAADLTIDKTAVDAQGAPVTSVSPGDSFSYVITVTNNGNGDATGVVVTDDLDDSLSIDSASYAVDGGASSGCDTGAGNTIRCPQDPGTETIQPGGAMVVTVDVTTDPAVCATLVNTAHVAWDGNTSGGLDSSEVSVDVTGCASDLSITKTANVTTIGPSGLFTYTVTVTNTGNAQATGVAITDDLPNSLIPQSATFDVDPGAAGGTGNCDIGVGDIVNCPGAGQGTITLGPSNPNDQSDTVVVTIQVKTGNTCRVLHNSSSVNWNENPNASTALTSDRVDVTVTGCSIAISKAASTVSPTVGAQFDYTILAESLDILPVTDVTITDTIPANLTIVSATYDVNPGAAGGTGNCTVLGQDVTCSVGTLAGYDKTTGDGPDAVIVTITVEAPSSCVQIQNTAAVQWTENGSEPPVDSNAATVTVTGCAPGLTLHKSGPTTVSVGGTVTYTVTVGNTGNADAADVTVTDAVDASLTNVQATPSQGSCSVVANGVSCDLGTIAPGGSATISISGTAPTATCPTITNQAFIGELGSEIVTTTVTGCTPPPPPPPPPSPTPGIHIVKDGPATAHVGDTITYTFDVNLISGSPSLTNVTVTDPICDAGTLTGPTGDDGDSVLEQSETWGYTCTHVVTSSDPDPLPNTATAEGHSGGTTVTDDDSHEVDIVHPAIQIQKQARPQSGSPGDEITYTYTVTNIGDVELFDISVDDDVIGHICDIASLAPGESQVCTATYTIPEDSPAHIRNVAVAEGHDEWGVQVRDEDTEVIDFVLGQTITPTTAPPTKTPPGGTAFTGSSAVIPLSVVALILLTAGTALLWVGRRRGRHSTTR